jgi:hypothetical protein
MQITLCDLTVQRINSRKILSNGTKKNASVKPKRSYEDILNVNYLIAVVLLSRILY